MTYFVYTVVTWAIWLSLVGGLYVLRNELGGIGLAIGAFFAVKMLFRTLLRDWQPSRETLERIGRPFVDD